MVNRFPSTLMAVPFLNWLVDIIPEVPLRDISSSGVTAPRRSRYGAAILSHRSSPGYAFHYPRRPFPNRPFGPSFKALGRLPEQAGRQTGLRQVLGGGGGIGDGWPQRRAVGAAPELGLPAEPDLFPRGRRARQRLFRRRPKRVEHQRQVPAAELLSAFLVAGSDRRQLLEDEGEIPHLDVRPQRARLLGAVQE